MSRLSAQSEDFRIKLRFYDADKKIARIWSIYMREKPRENNQVKKRCSANRSQTWEEPIHHYNSNTKNWKLLIKIEWPKNICRNKSSITKGSKSIGLKISFSFDVYDCTLLQSSSDKEFTINVHKGVRRFWGGWRRRYTHFR